MKLRDLVGVHALDAVEIWFIDGATACAFRLNGVVHVAIEDPSDGYRSHLKSVRVTDRVQMRNSFPPVTVMCVLGNDHDDEVLSFVDTRSKKTVLRVGTTKIDYWYPAFVSCYEPQNFHFNQTKTS